MSQTSKILLVDDESNVLKALRRLFMDEEYQVFTAISVASGLHLLASSGPFDLVISDYSMPEMNGVAFLHRVKSTSPGTIRFLLTGFADSAEVRRALEEGIVHDCLSKPWDNEMLLDLVHDRCRMAAVKGTA